MADVFVMKLWEFWPGNKSVEFYVTTGNIRLLFIYFFSTLPQPNSTQDHMNIFIIKQYSCHL